MPFDLLDHPITFVEPRYLTAHSGWIEHIPFAFLLVDLLRPTTVVELGTHTGDSYCAFCQAVDVLRLGTQCAAVDHWRGDPHAGLYGAKVLQELRQYHDPLYGRFSRLIQSDFDAAVVSFPDQSIDLLHIDGLHTYEAVKHDFATWRPKLSSRAVVLFHDTAETSDDFGVYRLWEQISGQFPSFEFKHGHGLGVLTFGDSVPQPVLDFLSEAARRPEPIRDAFARLGQRLSARRSLSLVLHSLHQQQTLINAFKREIGQPVTPASEQIEAALENPTGFAQYAVEQVQAAMHYLRKQAGRRS